MERNILTVLAVLWILTGSAFADVVMLPPDPPAPIPPPNEHYSPSRFGFAPVKPELGVGPHYASEAAEDLEDGGSHEDPEGSRANRSPAGVGFSQQPGVATANPVVPESGMPKSFGNMNPKPAALSRTGVQEVALIAGDLGFFPKTVFVSRDIPVKLYVTGASKKPLCIMMDSFQVRKQIRSQKIEEIDFTPTAPGQYRFYCPVNGMEGTLLVKELTTSRSPASTNKATGE